MRRLNRYRLSSVIAACVALVMASSCFLPRLAFANPAILPPLDVHLVIDNTDYKINDEITVSVFVENRSRRTQYIFVPLDWGESASFSLWVKNSVSGEKIAPDFLSDAISLPPRSKDSFARLLPGELIGLQFTSSFSELGIHDAGTYEFVAVYHSPVPSAMSFGLPIWSKESGPLRSNSVIVSVRE
jgi:hypothetical protein